MIVVDNGITILSQILRSDTRHPDTPGGNIGAKDQVNHFLPRGYHFHPRYHMRNTLGGSGNLRHGCQFRRNGGSWSFITGARTDVFTTTTEWFSFHEDSSINHLETFAPFLPNGALVRGGFLTDFFALPASGDRSVEPQFAISTGGVVSTGDDIDIRLRIFPLDTYEGGSPANMAVVIIDPDAVRTDGYASAVIQANSKMLERVSGTGHFGASVQFQQSVEEIVRSTGYIGSKTQSAGGLLPWEN